MTKRSLFAIIAAAILLLGALTVWVLKERAKNELTVVNESGVGLKSLDVELPWETVRFGHLAKGASKTKSFTIRHDAHFKIAGQLEDGTPVNASNGYVTGGQYGEAVRVEVGRNGAVKFAQGHRAGEAIPTSRSRIVVCASEFGGPWKVIAEGLLTQSTVDFWTEYRLETPRHTFSWTEGRTNPDSLIGVFFPYGSRTNPRGPLAVDELPSRTFHRFVQGGEIRERAGNIALTVGPSCLAPELARWPNPIPSVERDAPQAGRPSR